MEMFGRYQLQVKLGQGGMGVVYRAFDTVLERVVALKLVLTPEELDPEMRERFFREARAAGHLSHKNVVTVYDLGEARGQALPRHGIPGRGGPAAAARAARSA